MSDSGIDLQPGTTRSSILVLLYSNPDTGFRPGEIREHLGIPQDPEAILDQLHGEEYIERTNDGCYRALDDRETLFRYAASVDQLERLFSTLAKDGRESTSGAENTCVERIDDAELEAELTELEEDLETDEL